MAGCRGRPQRPRGPGLRAPLFSSRRRPARMFSAILPPMPLSEPPVSRRTLRLASFLSLIAAAAAAPMHAAAQSPFSFVKWRSIGPVNTSGRIDDIAVARVPGEADAVYVATASGGLWKSANNGISWTPVFDGVDAMMSIGAVAVAPSSPQTVWLGTGEANNRQSSSWGDGVYKSTDGG